VADGAGGFSFLMEAGIWHDPASVPDDDLLIADLRADISTTNTDSRTVSV